jgi:hypothetical protein
MACRATLCVPRRGRAIGRACEQVRNLRDLLVDSPRTTRTRARRSCAQAAAALEPPAKTRNVLTAQHTLMRIRAYHERENRAIAHERVQCVDCVDRVFVIVCVITVPVRGATEKKPNNCHEGDCECCNTLRSGLAGLGEARFGLLLLPVKRHRGYRYR